MAGTQSVMRFRRALAVGSSVALHAGAIACVLLLAAALRQPEPLFVDLTPGAQVGAAQPPVPQGSSGPKTAAPARAPGRAGPRAASLPSPARPPEIIPAPEAPRLASPETAAADSLASPAGEPAVDGARSAPAGAPVAGAGSGMASDAPSGVGQPSGGGGGSRLALAGLGTGRSEVPAEFGPYLAGFRRRIQELVVYPLAARRRGLAGRVEVEVVLEPTGRVRDVAVVASSSYSMLDDAAIEAVKSLPPVPLPENLPRRPLRVRLPIVFDLR